MKLHAQNYYVESEVSTLERVLFRMLFFTTVFLLAVAMVFTWIETWSPVGVFVLAIYSAVTVLYGIIVFRKKSFRYGYFLLCIFNNCILMTGSYFLCGGMNSGMPVFFMLGLVTCSLCVDQRLSVYSAIASVIGYIAVFVIEVLYPDRVSPFVGTARIVDIVFSFVFVGTVYLIFMRSVMGSYYRLSAKQMKELNKRNDFFNDAVDTDKERTAALHRMRHDLRHHTNVLVEMLEEGRSEEALHYLKTSLDADAVYDRKVYCMNGTLNGVLNYIARKCIKNQVSLEVDADIMEGIGVDSNDLVAIAANMLENAVNGTVAAGAENRRVKFKAFCKAGKLIMNCENNCRPDVVVVDGMVGNRSTGVQSILSGLEPYDGTVTYQVKNGWITCHILLNLKNKKE